MMASLITAQLQPGRVDEAARLLRESLGPALAGQRGFRGGWLLLDHDSCRCVRLTLWDSAADLRAADLLGGPQPLAQTFASTPTREVYEAAPMEPFL
jgi:hypothetical protein